MPRFNRTLASCLLLMCLGSSGWRFSLANDVDSATGPQGEPAGVVESPSEELPPESEDSGSLVIATMVLEDVGPGVEDDGNVIEPEFRTLSLSSVSSEDEPSENTDEELLQNIQDDNPEIIYFSLGNNSLSSAAGGRNGYRVGAALDALAARNNPNVIPLLQSLHELNQPTAQGAVLDALSGEVYASMQSVGLQIGDRALRSVAMRLINSNSLLADGDSVLTAQRPLDAGNLIVRRQSPFGSVSGWVQGYGVDGGFSGNGNYSAADYQLGGISFGIDLAGDEWTVVGISGGLGWTDFNSGDSHGDVSSFQVGLYALRRFEEVGYAMAIAQYGHLDYHVNRQVTLGQLTLNARSQPTGDAFQSYSEAGVDLDWCLVRLQPFVGLQYQLLSNGKAFEQGAGPANLTVDDETINALYTHVGSRLIFFGWDHPSGATLTPYLNVRWMADLVGDSRAVQSGLAAAPGAVWTVSGARPGRQYGMFGGGLLLNLSEQWSLYANYDFQVAERFQAHTGSGGLLLKF